MIEQINRAGFWIRVLAVLIDSVALLFLWLLLTFIEFQLAGRGLTDRNTVLILTLGIYGFILLYTATEMTFGGTPGKLLLGLRIRRIDGARPPMAMLVSRWTVKWSFLLLGLLGLLLNQLFLTWLGNLMTLILLIGCLAAAGETKLSWHDRWAKTAVFKIRRRHEPSGFEPIVAGAPPHEDADIDRATV